MSSLVDRHNVRSLALNIVMKPVPTVELRRLNPSLFMLLKSNERWGTEKSWAELEQADLYIRNGMNCNNTCLRCSSRLNILSRYMLFRRRKNVNLRKMKLAHRNCLGLNARRPVFGVYDHARLKPTCSVTERTCS